MEQINKVEIRGTVGNSTLSEVANTRMCRFAVVTNYAYKDRDDQAIIESTWHNVVAFENKEISCLDRVVKGAKVEVAGRLRVRRYTAQDGTDRSFMEIYAYRVNVLDDVTEALSPEM